MNRLLPVRVIILAALVLPMTLFSASLESTLQPIYECSLPDMGIDSGSGAFGFKRARLALVTENAAAGFAYDAEIKVDFTESGTPYFLNTCFIDATLKKQIKVKIGRFKVPFGMEVLTGPAKLAFVDRSRSSGMVKDAQMAGYQDGLMVHGKLPFKTSYGIGIFNNRANLVSGYNLLELAAARVRWKPLKILAAEYAIAYSDIERVPGQEYQAVFNNAGLTHEPVAWYKGRYEALWGSDSIARYVSGVDPLRYALVTDQVFSRNAGPYVVRFALGIELISRPDNSRDVALRQGIDFIVNKELQIRLNHSNGYTTSLRTLEDDSFMLSVLFQPCIDLGGKTSAGEEE